MTSASKIMYEAFGLGVGSPVIECVCGRTYCAPDSPYLEDGEREEILAAAKGHPTRVFLQEGVDGISAKVVSGATVVLDCECNYLARLEGILWNERERILRYYKLRREADAAALRRLDDGLGEAT